MGDITQTYKLTTDDEKKHRLYCKACSGLTLHSVVSSFDENGGFDQNRNLTSSLTCSRYNPEIGIRNNVS
jgi:hypothetical protein